MSNVDWVDIRAFAPADCPRDGQKSWDWYFHEAISHILKKNITDPDVVGTLYLPPPGRYKIDSPLEISNIIEQEVLTSSGRRIKREFAFRSIVIIEASAGGNALHGSSIVTSYDNKPAIIIQGGRQVRLKNLAITGLNN
jgi:hypothetical protein